MGLFNKEMESDERKKEGIEELQQVMKGVQELSIEELEKIYGGVRANSDMT